jgi:hypothetical protein
MCAESTVSQCIRSMFEGKPSDIEKKHVYDIQHNLAFHEHFQSSIQVPRDFHLSK